MKYWYIFLVLSAPSYSAEFLKTELLQLCGGTPGTSKACEERLFELETSMPTGREGIAIKELVAEAYLNHGLFDFPGRRFEGEPFIAKSRSIAQDILTTDRNNQSALKTLANGEAFYNKLAGYLVQDRLVELAPTHENHRFAAYLLGRIEIEDILRLQEEHYLHAISSAPSREYKVSYANEFYRGLIEKGTVAWALEFKESFVSSNSDLGLINFADYLARIRKEIVQKASRQLAEADIPYYCGTAFLNLLGAVKCRELLAYAVKIGSGELLRQKVLEAYDEMAHLGLEKSGDGQIKEGVASETWE